MRQTNTDLFIPETLAERLGKSLGTLKHWRSHGEARLGSERPGASCIRLKPSSAGFRAGGAARQSSIRKNLGLTQAAYQKLKRRGPFCEDSK